MLIRESKRNYLCGVGWFIFSLFVCIGNDSIMKSLGGRYQTMQIIFLRYLFAIVSLLPCMFNRQAFYSQHLIMHFCRAIMLTLGIAMYCFSLAYLPFSTVITVNFTIPIFTLILAYIFLKEKINKSKIIATVAGFIGIWITTRSMSTFASWATIMLVASAVMFAALDVINKKFVVQEGILTMLFYTAIFTLMLTVLPAWNSWNAVLMKDWMAFIMLGFGANLLLFCILKAFAKVDVSSIAPFRYIEFILSVIVGFTFFNEIPTKETMIGVSIIVPSTLYIILSNVKEDHSLRC